MIAGIKAEFLKLLTIRSTYITIALALALICFFSLYLEGYRGVTGSAASTVSSGALQEIVSSSAGFGALFVSIMAVLFMAHEYRYNTIMYTLTQNARRTKVLLQKMLTISIFGILCGFLFVLFALGCYMVGLSLRNASLPAQNFEVIAAFSKVAFYYLGYSLLGLILATIARNVVPSIAILFLMSTMVEPLLGMLLKEKAKYLPITALDTTIGASVAPHTLTAGGAVALSSFYLVIGVLAAWLLFTRRDAS